ncbi:DUF885 domain-containing protein [Pontibacter silvestris]|uniref:DUF885 domain-containing protein n=1 Tax=Pontibacter silvestris TaxID=2305183 RepID=A0ABW4WRP9_9BACT|nr:DUF885 domain-containing protein [Pontibacter silvestris]MCC9136181.1 DUF885 domain-containing protein [Pontibacter silvestris]
MRKTFFLILFTCFWACTSTKEKETALQVLPMYELAERYVKVVLKLGQYDSDVVDAYYGPEEWKPQEQPATDSLPVSGLLQELQLIKENLQNQSTDTLSELEKKRLIMFKKQVLAIITKVQMMQGREFSFDKEAELLYDAMPPHYEVAHFDSLLNAIDKELPGEGNIADRWSTYSAEFIIPKEKLDAVFQAAITEARKRTKAHYKLPENENFRVEYVTDKPWSGYNYFQGNGYSLIQVNTDFAINIERAIDLACHEGYPGHHVFNTLLEQHLVNTKGWKEFSVYPLFSPQSLIAEGSANYGIEVAFPAEERLAFEKEVLFPLAGLDTAEAERYYSILSKINQLNFAGNEAARLYLDGNISHEEAADWLMKYNFYEKGKALQRTRFIDRYRSYVINYNLGQELVREYVEAHGGTADNPEKRWEVFQELLSTPNTASMLQ